MFYPRIQERDCTIYFGEEFWKELNRELDKYSSSQIFVLMDENTQKECLSYFDQNLDKKHTYKSILISSGEQNKNLTTCIEVWQKLSKEGADRKSLLINLGGGVICDLGGFVAATYMRGIHWINIPTTLLSMVDASVGGKTGVDFNGLKNLIGIVRNPDIVGVDSTFLKTLSLRELRSGLAEMLKHALLTDLKYWNELKQIDFKTFTSITSYIYQSITIKKSIVSKDRYESGIRKQLNFGHTVGHAIETFFLHKNTPILHGEAVAAGIIIELYISMILIDFPKDNFINICRFISSKYTKISIQDDGVEEIIKIIAFDKKNEKGKNNFVLLQNIGKVKIDCQVPTALIQQAIEYYKKV